MRKYLSPRDLQKPRTFRPPNWRVVSVGIANRWIAFSRFGRKSQMDQIEAAYKALDVPLDVKVDFDFPVAA